MFPLRIVHSLPLRDQPSLQLPSYSFYKCEISYHLILYYFKVYSHTPACSHPLLVYKNKNSQSSGTDALYIFFQFNTIHNLLSYPQMVYSHSGLLSL